MNEKNELKEYIESNLTSRFDKFITIKDTEKAKYLYLDTERVET